MSDLVERLHWWGAKQKPPRGMDTLPADCREAASRISQQDAELERVRRENKALSELRRDLITLQKRIIGETGLSAIETIDRALKVFDAKHLYEIFDEERAASQEQGAEE